MRVPRAWAIALVFACLAAPASAETPWAPISEKQFSAEADKLFDRFGNTPWQSSDREVWAREKLVGDELTNCIGAGPLEPCVGMILKGWSLLPTEQRPIVEKALAIAEAQVPVDLLTIAGDRRLPATGPVAVAGLQRLSRIARVSRTLHGDDDARSVRRQAAFDVAQWRAGGMPDSEFQKSLNPTLTVSKADPEASAMVRNVALSHVATNGWVLPETLATALELRRELGPQVASNLALLQLSNGEVVAAEASAREGYDALVAARGLDDPRSIAAASVLATVLYERNKQADALPFARIAFEGLKKDRFATALQKIDAGVLYAKALPAAERGAIEAETLALIDAQVSRPLWPVFAAFRSEFPQTATDVEIAARDVKATQEAGIRGLRAKRGELLASQGFAAMSSDPARARKLLLEAAKSNKTPMVISLLAMLRLQSITDLSELAISTEPGSLIDIQSVQMNSFQSVDHPDQILSSLVGTAYYLRIDPSRAPAQARRGAEGAVKRMAQFPELNENALAEIVGLRPMFAAQVLANWSAAQAPAN